MTNQELLKLAIQIAIQNGWKPWIVPLDKDLPLPQWAVRIMEVANWAEIIYNHEFAKSLFGDDGWYHGAPKPMKAPYIEDKVRKWQYHLQMMVISPDPIDYLRTYLSDIY